MTEEPESTPRWVKISGIVALVLVVVVVVLLVTGTGNHGPGRHAPSGDSTPAAETGAQARPTRGHTQA
jgi:hypothetical protein